MTPAQNFRGHTLPAMCLVGLGMSAVVAPQSTAVMGAVSEDRAGIASGINNAVSRMAGLVSVAAVGGIVASVYASAGGTAGFGVPSDSPNHADAMTAAFSGLAYVAAALAGLSALVADLFVRQQR